MTESTVTEPGAAERTDAKAFEPGYGKGGVPFLLLIFYLSFLVFFTWYVLEYQLPDYLEQGPGRAAQTADQE
jgi:hypothetical protein